MFLNKYRKQSQNDRNLTELRSYNDYIYIYEYCINVSSVLYFVLVSKVIFETFLTYVDLVVEQTCPSCFARERSIERRTQKKASNRRAGKYHLQFNSIHLDSPLAH